MPEPVDLGVAVRLPPDDAIAYFRSKGYRISWNWWDTWRDAHAQAFTVAKATRAEVLEAIRGEVQKALAEGLTEREFAKLLEPTLRKLGWWGRQEVTGPQGVKQQVTLGSPWRLKVIYRTNLQTAYMAGRYRAQVEAAASRPYWRYVAILDNHTRPSHRALHGKVWRYDDPVWDWLYPPNAWGCRCRVTTLSARQLKRKGLKVESSGGRIGEVMREVGVDKQTGEIVTRPVKTYRYTDPVDGREKTFVPDPGWDYNPGKRHWDPDPGRWEGGIGDQYKAAVSPTRASITYRPGNLGQYVAIGQTWVGKLDRYARQSNRDFQSALLIILANEVGTALQAEVANQGDGAELIRQASLRYPDPWVRAANALGRLRVLADRSEHARGWAMTVGETLDNRRFSLPHFGIVQGKRGDGYIVVRHGDIANAVHEYGHRLQAAMPGLQTLFAELHRKRTSGDPLKRLRDLEGPRYRKDEWTREDNYFSAYQGKEYNGEPLDVLTMAFEWVLGAKPDRFNEFRHHDPEMLALVLGVLFHFEP